MNDERYALLERRVKKLEKKVRSIDAFIVLIILAVATFWFLELVRAG